MKNNSNFGFVYILTDNTEDGLEILEQILPFWSPAYTTAINFVPELGLSYDVPVTLNSVTQDDNYETTFEDKRLITWQLQFTAKSWVFGPITDQGIIKRVFINEYIPKGGSTLEITPEQIANTTKSVQKIGEPDPFTAGPDDPWEFKLTIDEFE